MCKNEWIMFLRVEKIKEKRDTNEEGETYPTATLALTTQVLCFSWGCY